ncbi:hypothetical protein AVEN_143641-1 [Araneus ventricosus]|uniref:Uncharacterized protein n=1 Tax=Araneus ventricosus TaxID=182803 RepID=A0A4Y2AN54_ARAVE|nr:hypothetical protein AVEN_143641-1 [Araneus ventricosus]
MDSEDIPTLIESSEPGTSKSEMRKYFITPKFIAAIDRCQLKSEQENGRNTQKTKIDFQNKVQDVVTLHWDGKQLPALSARKSKEERLPIVISYGLKEQLIAVPRLDNSTGKGCLEGDLRLESRRQNPNSLL